MIIKITSKTFVFILMIFNLLIGQGDPAHPAPIDERIRKGEIKSVWIENQIAEIYPEPIEVNYYDEYFNLFDPNGKPRVILLVDNDYSTKASNIINRQLSKFNYKEIPKIKEVINDKIHIRFTIENNKVPGKGEQAYCINWNDNNSIITVYGNSENGLYYGAASLAQCITVKENAVVIRKVNVLDYPKFNRRVFNTELIPKQLEDDLDWMLRYKMECFTFHNKDYSWNNIDASLVESLNIFNKWRSNFGGVEGNILLNLYKGSENIEATNEVHIQKLKDIITTVYKNGVSRIMLMSDDAPPFKYSEGYILKTDKDKEKFNTLVESHCWIVNNIVNWKNQKNYDIEIYYCPGFYTYEEMHYGDMELFKNTPWENDAYGPLNRDLKIIGEQMSDEVFIIWTGPNVCSKVISKEDINEWTRNLKGRTPFLFDNTIFLNNEYTMRSMFTPYGNDFSPKFEDITAGNGIYINGDAFSENSKSASMTANAYLWEGDRYNPQVSIISAMERLYGANVINVLLKYKSTELELNKTIKQRRLWFVSDELYEHIRKTRFITEKNPFYYHQNYSRLKALRLQLKCSVPEPEKYTIYKEKCIELDIKRRILLKKIEELSFSKLSYSLQSEMISLPNFSKNEN